MNKQRLQRLLAPKSIAVRRRRAKVCVRVDEVCDGRGSDGRGVRWDESERDANHRVVSLL